MYAMYPNAPAPNSNAAIRVVPKDKRVMRANAKANPMRAFVWKDKPNAATIVATKGKFAMPTACAKLIYVLNPKGNIGVSRTKFVVKQTKNVKMALALKLARKANRRAGKIVVRKGMNVRNLAGNFTAFRNAGPEKHSIAAMTQISAATACLKAQRQTAIINVKFTILAVTYGLARKHLLFCKIRTIRPERAKCLLIKKENTRIARWY